MNDLVSRLCRGALAGLVGTLPMTAVIGMANASGVIRTPPPKEVTARVVRQAGPETEAAASRQFSTSWLLSHALFGVASGVGYSLLRPGLPASPVTAGLAYGGLVWAVNYLGVLPRLGLYLWPNEDSLPRIATMIVAHAVYGTTTAEVDRRIEFLGQD